MRKLTRTEASFDNLIHTAVIVEGYECTAAGRGCRCGRCRECSEDEESYGEENNDEIKDPFKELLFSNQSRRDNFKQRGYRASYDEENESMDNLSKLSNTINAVVATPAEKELEQRAGGQIGDGSDPVLRRIKDFRKKKVDQLDKYMQELDNP